MAVRKVIDIPPSFYEKRVAGPPPRPTEPRPAVVNPEKRRPARRRERK